VSGCGLIVVAGGGIGGAAAAVALQARGFEVAVLEADPSLDARKQGYGLTLQRADATQALGISLAADDAPSTSHYTFSANGQIINFYGEAFGRRERRHSENSGRFVHLPRQVLRARIVEQVRPGTIRWSSRLESFTCRGDCGSGGGVTITLTDGTALEASLLVGSDGIFSAVRRELSLPGDRLNYVGFVVVLGIVDEAVMAIPLARRRIFETVDGTTRIYAMPFTTTSTMWQLSFPCVEAEARAFGKDPAALKAEILVRCGGWHEPIPELLRATPLDCMSGYPVYDRELLEPGVLRPKEEEKKGKEEGGGGPPQPQRRVTLMGDAAHPMTPFKAQGANQALVDAVLLAETLVEGVRKHGAKAGLDAALPLFERKMLSRSARAVVGSREKAKELHSRLALQPARKAQRETGVDMGRVIAALQAKGIGAHTATDPRGLDAVVAEAAGISAGAPAGEVEAGKEEEKKGRRNLKKMEEVTNRRGAGEKLKNATEGAGEEGKAKKKMNADKLKKAMEGAGEEGKAKKRRNVEKLNKAMEGAGREGKTTGKGKQLKTVNEKAGGMETKKKRKVEELQKVREEPGEEEDKKKNKENKKQKKKGENLRKTREEGGDVVKRRKLVAPEVGGRSLPVTSIERKGQAKKARKERTAVKAIRQQPIAAAAVSAKEEASPATADTKADLGDGLAAVTLRLLGKGGKQAGRGIPRLKLRKKVLEAMQSSVEGGAAMKKGAVRREWEEVIAASSRFRLDGDLVYAA